MAAGDGAVTTDHLRRVFLGLRGGGTLRQGVRCLPSGSPSRGRVHPGHARQPGHRTRHRACAPNLPPAAISWLVTALFWVGSRAWWSRLAVLALLVLRLAAVRWSPWPAGGLGRAWCAARRGSSHRGQVSTTALAGVDTSYPVISFAVTIAVAGTAPPTCAASCTFGADRGCGTFTSVAALGAALPVNALSSVAIGRGIAAALHLALGSPLGLPSAAEVAAWDRRPRCGLTGVVRAPRQAWGLEKFTGQDGSGVLPNCRSTPRRHRRPGAGQALAVLLLP